MNPMSMSRTTCYIPSKVQPDNNDKIDGNVDQKTGRVFKYENRSLSLHNVFGSNTISL